MNERRLRKFSSGDGGSAPFRWIRGPAPRSSSTSLSSSAAGSRSRLWSCPSAGAPYAFPELATKAFKGLPGLLADSLPDKYGNALFDAWLASQGREAESANAIERLGYTGKRGMGALEFAPVKGPKPPPAREIELAKLVELASEVLTERERFITALREGAEEQAMKDILSVGTSAGGARAKAVIAWNRESGEIRSGQVDAGSGFEHWLLKFDGVSAGKDRRRPTSRRDTGRSSTPTR